MRLMSLDVEASSLMGKGFIVDAVISDEKGDVQEQFTARWPIPQDQLDPWVKENVIPKCSDIPVTHDSYDEMLKSFVHFWQKWEKPIIVSHMPFPVETNFMTDCYRLGYVKEMEGFYGIFSIETSLATLGYPIDSVEKFLEENRVSPQHESRASELRKNNRSHNPSYDTLVALLTHLEIGEKIKKALEVYEKNVKETEREDFRANELEGGIKRA